MGISSDGQICYGIAFEEDYPFPWVDKKWEGNAESWWFKDVCGYKPLFEMFDKDGMWINGEEFPKEKISEYYADYDKFKAANPMPVEIEMYCSYDYPMYIVSVPGTTLSASRGYTEEFTPSEIDPVKAKAVIDFCEKYCKSEDEYCEFPKMKPGWLLSSMYG